MYERIGVEIVNRLQAAQGRLRPYELIRDLTKTLDVPAVAVKQVLANLVARGEMIYSYRDPCSYIELVPEAGR